MAIFRKTAHHSLALGAVFIVLTACSSGAANTSSVNIEPSSIDALIEVVKTSPGKATILSLSTPEEKVLSAKRDNLNYSLDLLAPSGQVESEIYSDKELYLAQPEDAKNIKWVRIVDRGVELDELIPSRLALIETLTIKPDTDASFDSIADLLDSEGLIWSDFSISRASCAETFCDYELRTSQHKYMQPEETTIILKTEYVKDAEHLTSLTLSWFETTLELGYAPQVVSAPDLFTEISYELFITGAADIDELRIVMDTAKAYLEDARVEAVATGRSLTSHTFWETYLAKRVPAGASLWAALANQSDSVRELVGPTEPYTSLPVDIGESISNLSFSKDNVWVCMDLVKIEVQPGDCSALKRP